MHLSLSWRTFCPWLVWICQFFNQMAHPMSVKWHTLGRTYVSNDWCLTDHIIHVKCKSKFPMVSQLKVQWVTFTQGVYVDIGHDCCMRDRYQIQGCVIWLCQVLLSDRLIHMYNGCWALRQIHLQDNELHETCDVWGRPEIVSLYKIDCAHYPKVLNHMNDWVYQSINQNLNIDWHTRSWILLGVLGGKGWSYGKRHELWQLMMIIAFNMTYHSLHLCIQ